MSDLNQISTALARLFDENGQRIVFWNDPDKEFQSTLPYIMLDGVTTIRLDQTPALEVKIRLEREEPDKKFLLYAPTEEPDYEDDWLLDIRLYSRSFRADRASILLQDLGLKNLSLRAHIAERRKFFDAKERLQKVRNLVGPDDAAADLDRKMIAVVARADQPELFNLVRTLFHAWIDAGSEIDLDNPPAEWVQVEKFDLDGSFWHMVKAAFGYEEENPTLKMFLLRLMLTDYTHHLKGDVPQSIRGLLLPRTGWSNAVVCLAQWRDSSSKGTSYDRLSAEAAAILKIEDHLPNVEIDQLIDVMTFLAVEKRIASSLRERVQTTADTINADDVRAIAIRRQSGHWATLTVADSTDAPRQALHAVYDALVAASDFYALRNQHKSGFDYPDAAGMYRAYESELYRFDQLYRHFCEAADSAEGQGWNIVKPLRADLEAHYINWYLTGMALAWGKFIEPQDGLLTNWQIGKVPNQYRFYEKSVKPYLEEADNRRAFVIISDAFRYEAAQELTTELNGKYRFEATISSQLGVLPSYTALGMASLLPHKTLGYKGTDVLVDGRSSVAGERDGILKAVGGLACKYDELMAKKKEEGREFVRDKRVVYIYHDVVDAIGDDGKTEGKTFEAVRTAINELAALVGYIVNNLNGHHILVTADHGFLFTETARVETDKSKLSDKPDGTILAKKRYLIGPNLPDHEAAWHGKLSVTARADGDMEFWIPKGANLFHFVGGARFVHGGAMPQEIVVPVVTVKHIRGKSAQETKTKPVTVQVLGSNHRITTAYCRFQLIQMEAVSDRVKPITLRVAVYEGDEPVTGIQTVKFESSSGNLDERKKWVNLVLKDRQYNKKTPYRLVLLDAETGIEQQSVEVIIDRAFTDDF
ncbi:BREX-1 system phosphatase PglZ type A [Tautonia marina]|uniref:BREX-1 system phosphatase PglZ type A n=1 Tax=Tautonia marina TaxID=2653855 RepID=UPI0012610C7E|nr:BREX-1 system phosphatase PglZ type A [Tautonia marina]